MKQQEIDTFIKNNTIYTHSGDAMLISDVHQLVKLLQKNFAKYAVNRYYKPSIPTH